MSAPLEVTGRMARVRFERTADRYGHTIEVCAESGFVSLFQSLEAAADDAWPSSPPLQDLHIEHRAGGVQVALLVGRAGRSHWSLSILVDPASDIIEFDAACRTSDTPLWLGSTYRRLPQPSDLIEFQPTDGILTSTYRWRYALTGTSLAGVDLSQS